MVIESTIAAISSASLTGFASMAAIIEFPHFSMEAKSPLSAIMMIGMPYSRRCSLELQDGEEFRCVAAQRCIVKDIGKPCALVAYARFDEGGQGLVIR